MNGTLDINLKNREKLIDAVREELIGPIRDFSNATLIDKDSNITFENNGRFYHRRFGGIDEEIFTKEKPSRKYASGLLYSSHRLNSKPNYTVGENESETEDTSLADKETKVNAVQHATGFRETNMGISFAVPESSKKLKIEFDCGVYRGQNNFNYELQKYKNSDKTSRWWLRSTAKTKLEVDLLNSFGLMSEELELSDNNGNHLEGNKIKVYYHIRDVELKSTDGKIKVVTITVENISDTNEEEESILFQSEIKAMLENDSFLPYPKSSDMNARISEEEKRFEMLYLNEENYSLGHNCSSTWVHNADDDVNIIKSTFLPEYQVKSMSPDIKLDDGSYLEIHHHELIACESYDEMLKVLSPLVEGYKKWLENVTTVKVPSYYEKEKNENLNQIKKSIDRIHKGMELLKDRKIFESFKLANLSMLMQMVNGKEIRKISYGNNLEFEKTYHSYFDNIDFQSIESISKYFSNYGEVFNNYKWRGFQIAFLLQSLNSFVDKRGDDRDIVDLIWFPTGGGKTEAYLAVSAFSMIYRRVINPSDNGTDVIMRYTLRLLTADQFQRSARLMISLEFIRRNLTEMLGENEYSIGLWVGGDTTPNRNEYAIKQLNMILTKNSNEEFIIESCPWCGSEIKPLRTSARKKSKLYFGFKGSTTLECYCPDYKCKFNDKLPIYFIDEEMYKNPPTFLIGTVDKFVQLSWNENCRAFFGINKKGTRFSSPPNLIIQDELHLLSGPLGSLTGIYEGLIEYLSSENLEGKLVKPKIISATATIKDYKDQVKSLYGRDDTHLFPPAGVDIDDNFFSTVKMEPDGSPSPGRKYIGVHTSTQGLLQTQVQVYSSLISQTSTFDENHRDPYWTILAFYNSIRDIGTAKLLTEIDMQTYLEKIYLQKNIEKSKKRWIDSRNVKELTSREPSHTISKSISELKLSYSPKTKKSVKDLCLASNIIEVGIDIDRLSLMAIVGQPKTTAQYIQVSGRVGRRTNERPGLIITMYNPNNSNDKSHFEHFNEYHQKLYAQVEVNSLTPYSDFSIRRGVPAIIIGFIRQFLNYDNPGRNVSSKSIKENEKEIQKFLVYIIKRAKVSNPVESKKLEEEAENFINKLYQMNFSEWEYKNGNNGLVGKLTDDKENLPDDVIQVIFSMRNVENSSKLKVQSYRNNHEATGEYKPFKITSGEDF